MTNIEYTNLYFDAALKQAVTCHQSGQLQQAEHIYRAILQQQPNHPDANHNLGVLALQMNQPVAALPYLKSALDRNSNCEQYWLSYCEALILAEKKEVAKQVLGQARQRGLQSKCWESLLEKLDGEQSEARTLPPHEAPRGERRKNKGCRLKSGRKVSLQRKPEMAPSLQEINALVIFFNQGRFAEMETLARTLTVRFPTYGIGWKALGTVIRLLGRSAESLAPLQKAAVLLPEDTEVHNTRGLALHEVGRLTEAAASFRRALELKPDYSEAHYNLGNTFLELECLNEAYDCYQRALQFKPDFTEAHYNLGNTLQELDRLDEAEVSYRQALQIKPDYAEAYSNLASILRRLNRLDEAESICREALKLKPEYAAAHNNLGCIFHESGNLNNAIVAFTKAIQFKPQMAEAYLNIGNTFRFMDRVEEESTAYKTALTLDPDNVGLFAALWLAIRQYLGGNMEQMYNLLLTSKPLLAKTESKFKSYRMYLGYLQLLFSWHQKNDKGPANIKSSQNLYVIGESHSLSAHGMVVSYRGEYMQCVAQWVEGCKQWHLGNDKVNRFKHNFERIMERLPRHSTILLTIGEIDCRPDGGILKASKKNPDSSVEEAVKTTIEGYVRYVAALGAQYGHRLIVGGVPATNIRLDTLTLGEREQFVNLIRIFNEMLNNMAIASGLDFLDIYSLTDRGDGIANGQWHIDNTHLLPSAMVEAFGQHCIYGDNSG